jgi:hypothetical protein
MTFVGIFGMIVGVFFLAGAVFNWDFLMKKGNLHSPLDLLPRQVSRIIMIIWGLSIFLGGLAMVLGIIK